MMRDCKRCNGVGALSVRGDDYWQCPDCEGTGSSVLPLSAYVPLFPTKTEAKAYRKQVLEYVATIEADEQEQAQERARILASFGKREPVKLGDDFIARWHYYTDGGTAVRRNRKRELKQQLKVQS